MKSWSEARKWGLQLFLFMSWTLFCVGGGIGISTSTNVIVFSIVGGVLYIVVVSTILAKLMDQRVCVHLIVALGFATAAQFFSTGLFGKYTVDYINSHSLSGATYGDIFTSSSTELFEFATNQTQYPNPATGSNGALDTYAYSFTDEASSSTGNSHYYQIWALPLLPANTPWDQHTVGVMAVLLVGPERSTSSFGTIGDAFNNGVFINKARRPNDRLDNPTGEPSWTAYFDRAVSESITNRGYTALSGGVQVMVLNPADNKYDTSFYAGLITQLVVELILLIAFVRALMQPKQ